MVEAKRSQWWLVAVAGFLILIRQDLSLVGQIDGVSELLGFQSRQKFILEFSLTIFPPPVLTDVRRCGQKLYFMCDSVTCEDKADFLLATMGLVGPRISGFSANRKSWSVQV
jgi:hypothetical protein